jgi:hypothetical protein
MPTDDKKTVTDDNNNIVSRLTEREDLVDILIDVENYLDENNLYVYKNWINGEIVDGPYIKRYWVTIKLKYQYTEMPDPEGGAVLLKHGTKIHYDIALESFPLPIKGPGDYQPGTKKPKLGERKVWIITVMIPRRFVQNLDREIMDTYDDEVDVETVDDATAEGLTPDNVVQQQ